MTTTTCNGRLGNQIIRNLAVSLIAEKHNLCVHYCNNDLIAQLGIKLFIGDVTHNNTIELNDANFSTYLTSPTLTSNLQPNDHFFQTREISIILYNYLHSASVKTHIIGKNPFNKRYNANNDLCIHIRLTDATGWNPGINYYMQAISTYQFDNIYIATDDRTHSFIKQIVSKYPHNTTVLDYDEINTFQFASTCKNIILSHGSFSACIGYLAFFSNITYPKYEDTKLWYGDMFHIDGWTELSF
jgi:hypothetical protein